MMERIKPRKISTSGSLYSIEGLSAVAGDVFVPQQTRGSTSGVFFSGEAIKSVQTLNSSIRELTEEIRDLKAALAPSVEYRDITRAQAKQEIEGLLKQGDTFFPSEISQELQIEYEVVAEILAELQAAGMIAPRE
jgi:hypothetical protein